jgi:phage terminase large subunit GpA-like protein
LVKDSGGYLSKGYQFNQWASPFVTWQETVAEFLAAKDDPYKLQVVVNTAFCETWKPPESAIPPESVAARCEDYTLAPRDVLAVTFGCDVQADRLEVNVLGWGRDEECWDLDYQIFEGDTEQDGVWSALRKYLSEGLKSDTGATLQINAGCIDSGYVPSQVGKFTSKYKYIYSTKGRSTSGALIESRTSRAKRLRNAKKLKGGERPELVGTDEGNLILYHRLKIARPGKRYIHFQQRDEEYFSQLTAHAMVKGKSRGKDVIRWEQTRPRDEVADTWILALAALRLISQNWDQLVKARERQIQAKVVPPPRQPTRSNFITGW